MDGRGSKFYCREKEGTQSLKGGFTKLKLKQQKKHWIERMILDSHMKTDLLMFAQIIHFLSQLKFWRLYRPNIGYKLGPIQRLKNVMFICFAGLHNW